MSAHLTLVRPASTSHAAPVTERIILNARARHLSEAGDYNYRLKIELSPNWESWTSHEWRRRVSDAMLELEKANALQALDNGDDALQPLDAERPSRTLLHVVFLSPGLDTDPDAKLLWLEAYGHRTDVAVHVADVRGLISGDLIAARQEASGTRSPAPEGERYRSLYVKVEAL